MTGNASGITFGETAKSADRRVAAADHPGADIFKWHFEDCLIPGTGWRPHAGITADGFPLEGTLDVRDLLLDDGIDADGLDSLLDFQREAARSKTSETFPRGYAIGAGHAEFAKTGLYGIDQGFVASLLSAGKGMVDG